jgi:hypothetical protein
METTPSRTFRLVTVNTAPERAKLLIGRMIKGLEGRYTVEHVANCSGMCLILPFIPSLLPLTQIFHLPSFLPAELPPAIEQVSPTVKELQPDILFSASMWTPEQAKEIREIAERERPGIKTHAIPQGLQVERGPDGVVEYLLENVPGVLESIGQ